MNVADSPWATQPVGAPSQSVPTSWHHMTFLGKTPTSFSYQRKDGRDAVGAGGDGNYNVGRYSNPQMDALVERVKVETDLKNRNELIEKALILANEDAAYIPLHNQIIPWAMKKNVEVVHRADNRLDWRLIKVN